MTKGRMQYSLRTLLIITTVIAFMLAYVPGLTGICVSTAVVLTLTLILVEASIYFHRIVSLLTSVMFFAIGSGSLALIAAVYTEKLEGHTSASKLIILIFFGVISVACYCVSWAVFRDASVDSDVVNIDNSKSRSD